LDLESDLDHPDQLVGLYTYDARGAGSFLATFPDYDKQPTVEARMVEKCQSEYGPVESITGRKVYKVVTIVTLDPKLYDQRFPVELDFLVQEACRAGLVKTPAITCESLFDVLTTNISSKGIGRGDFGIT
jgi:hypothetical protein